MCQDRAVSIDSQFANQVAAEKDYIEYPQPYESLFRIQRALAGHVSYLAACEANVAFTEYLLYETILRVLMVQQYEVKCEFPCSEFMQNKTEYKRIDFVAYRKDEGCFALEVKWPQGQIKTLNVKRDHEKLDKFQRHYEKAKSFLCVFGRFSHINEVQLSPDAFASVKFQLPDGKEKELEPIFAKLKRTRFGCKMYQLKAQ